MRQRQNKVSASASGGSAGLTQSTVKARKTEMIVTSSGNNSTANNNAFPPRVAFAQVNRKSLIFRNMPYNTESLQVGRRDADNIQNGNADFTVSHTILPGKEVVIANDRAQWFMRQLTNSPVSTAYEIEEIFTL